MENHFVEQSLCNLFSWQVGRLWNHSESVGSIHPPKMWTAGQLDPALLVIIWSLPIQQVWESPDLSVLMPSPYDCKHHFWGQLKLWFCAIGGHIFSLGVCHYLALWISSPDLIQLWKPGLIWFYGMMALYLDKLQDHFGRVTPILAIIPVRSHVTSDDLSRSGVTYVQKIYTIRLQCVSVYIYNYIYTNIWCSHETKLCTCGCSATIQQKTLKTWRGSLGETGDVSISLRLRME